MGELTALGRHMRAFSVEPFLSRRHQLETMVDANKIHSSFHDIHGLIPSLLNAAALHPWIMIAPSSRTI